MSKRTSALRILEYAIFIAIMYAGIQLAIYFGLEEKTWFQRSWEFVTGGTLGILAGIGFFIFFGSIGWVCGPSLYGAIGLLGLSAMGALGGLGVGAIINIIRDPDAFNYTWTVIVPVLLCSAIVARLVSTKVTFKVESRLVMPEHLETRKRDEQISPADD